MPSKFEFYGCRVEKKDYTEGRHSAKFTKTVFLPGTMAVTGTSYGDILVWDESLIIEGVGEQNEKRLIKIVTLNQDKDKDADKKEMSAIMQIMTVNVGNQIYLVVGIADGTIRFYDTDFKVLAWFED